MMASIASESTARKSRSDIVNCDDDNATLTSVPAEDDDSEERVEELGVVKVEDGGG